MAYLIYLLGIVCIILGISLNLAGSGIIAGTTVIAAGVWYHVVVRAHRQ